MSAVSANTLTSASSEDRPEPGPGPNVLLLDSLRRLMRGLSALFWGLPAALVISFQIAKGEWMRLGCIPFSAALALLLYGIHLLRSFQTQERIWMRSLEHARFIAVINLGLSPFLFFWARLPTFPFFNIAVEVLFVSMLTFLFLLNSVLARLAAMLPDETLRGETRLFTRINHFILLIVIPAQPFWFLLRGASTLPRIVVELLLWVERGGLLFELMLIMAFILLPVAMTMALLWKMKETILTGVFSGLGSERTQGR